MEDLIKQAFQQVDVLGPHVMERHYDLIGPNNEIILPFVWEKVIEPAWTIKMTMWPIEKSPPLKVPHMMGRHHGLPHPAGGGRIPGLHGVPPPGRRPAGSMPGAPPLPPGWGPRGMPMPNIPTNIEVFDADPRRPSKSKSKKAVNSFFLGGGKAPKKK